MIGEAEDFWDANDQMPQGPVIIFDKSSLESLNLDEAVLLDNFGAPERSVYSR
jgi:hypothetical protein